MPVPMPSATSQSTPATQSSAAAQAQNDIQNAATRALANANNGEKTEQEKEAEKLARAQEKEASKMPEQNGIRAPKPSSLCGKAWAVFDRVSQSKGSPTSVAEAVPVGVGEGLNEGNIRVEYARWRKYNGLQGYRIVPEKPPKPEAAATPPKGGDAGQQPQA